MRTQKLLLPPVQRLSRGRSIPPRNGLREGAWAESLVRYGSVVSHGEIVVRIVRRPVAAEHVDGLELTVRDVDGTLTIQAASNSIIGLSRAARIAIALIELAPDGLEELDIQDWPEIAHRGYLECFYGRPWPRDDRLRMLNEAASWGLNVYCYGPAGDEHTGKRWRKPYGAKDLAHLGDVAREAVRLGIELIWRVSPAAPLDPDAGIRYSGAADRSALVERFAQLTTVGIRSFMLTFDDLNEGLSSSEDKKKYGPGSVGLAHAHAELANFLAAKLATWSATLIVCPTIYWGTESSPYRVELSSRLDESIRMAWTGPEITSYKIAVDDVVAVQPDYSGQPWLWDNYPANDWDSTLSPDRGPRRRRLFLGPLEGRDNELHARLSGYSVNLGDQPFLNLPALATASMWAWCAQGYEPDDAWALVCAQPMLGSNDPELRKYQDFLSSSPVTVGMKSDFTRCIAEYQLSLEDDSGTQDIHAAELIGLIDSRIPWFSQRTGFDRAMSEWTDRFVFELLVARDVVEMLEAIRGGDEAKRRECAYRIALARERLDDQDAVLAANGILLSLIERGRSIAGAPPPPSDEVF